MLREIAPLCITAIPVPCPHFNPTYPAVRSGVHGNRHAELVSSYCLVNRIFTEQHGSGHVLFDISLAPALGNILLHIQAQFLGAISVNATFVGDHTYKTVFTCKPLYGTLFCSNEKICIYTKWSSQLNCSVACN